MRVNSFHFVYTVIYRSELHVCHMFMLGLRVLDPWQLYNLVNLQALLRVLVKFLCLCRILKRTAVRNRRLSPSCTKLSMSL